MKGTRPLDNTKIRLVSACFNGTFERRNRGLFMLGVSIGGRISELLSLTIGDVWQNQKPVTNLLFDKSIVKGGEISRAVPVNVDGREAIEGLICWHDEKYKTIVPSRPLFPSRNKGGSVAMNKQTAHEMLKHAFQKARLNGKLATHSLRKSFAQRLYEESSAIYLVQELLGHRNVATTQKYIGVNYATARVAVEAMALNKLILEMVVDNNFSNEIIRLQRRSLERDEQRIEALKAEGKNPDEQYFRFIFIPTQ